MLHRIPRWFQHLFPRYTWNLDRQEKIIYLTFDDGPIPIITEWVLETLKQYAVKGTFFVVGENASRHPQIINKINAEGHSIGNHTFHHLKGWGVSTHNYYKDVERCSDVIKEQTGILPKFFRPPHGRIKPSQAKLLREKYELIMWDTLTVDYDKNLDEKKCLTNSIRATRAGSIVVFHDSIKAEKNLRYVLPKYIEHFQKLGYIFNAL